MQWGRLKVTMKLLKFCLLLCLTQAVYALKTVYLPAELQTKQTSPVARTFYLKLPLQQADRDWVFSDAASLLQGGMELRIIRQGKVVEQIVIFSQGEWAPGWLPMLPPVPTTPDAIYFGFISTKLYLTAPDDLIELRLQVVKPLKGMGPVNSGILPAGLYIASGRYSGLTDQFDLKGTQLFNTVMQNEVELQDKQTLVHDLAHIYNYAAFLNAWQTSWPLTITTNSGWLNEYNQPEDSLL